MAGQEKINNGRNKSDRQNNEADFHIYFFKIAKLIKHQKL
jgi:hypothetical protein